MTADQTPNDAGLQQVDARVDQLADLVEREIQATQASARRLWLGGAVLIVIVIGYMSWIFSQLRPWTDPEEVALVLQQTALDQLEPLSESLETALRDSAPDLTRQVTQTVIKSIPELRKEIEKHGGKVADELVEYIDGHIGELIDQVIRDYKKDIEDVIPLLETKEGTAKFRKIMEDACRESVLPSLDAQIQDYLDAIRAVRRKLERLQSAPDLTPEEKMEREIIATWAIFLDQAINEAKAGSKDLG